MSRLGDVFRNAKWSDLTVQNIKKNFLVHKFTLVKTCAIIALLTFTCFPQMYSVLYESLAYVRTTLSTLNQLLIGVFTAIHLTFNYTFKKLLNRIESKVLWELSEISYKPSNEYATDLPKLSNELYYTSLTAPVYELSSNIKLADDGEVLVNFFQKNDVINHFCKKIGNNFLFL